MSKKIGIFLTVMLVVCSVLLMMATTGRAPASPTETTASTAPPETAELPETTAPPDTHAAQTQPPAESEPETAERVRQILEQEGPELTAVTPMAQTALEIETDAGGQRRASYANALAGLAREREMNPIAMFWELVYEGLYQKERDGSGVLYVDALTVPGHAAKQYPYSDEGVRSLLTELLATSAELDDGVALELALLGANGAVEADQVHFAEAEGCRYAYFSCASEHSTHILCFYLRTDGEGEWITDVEFQLLNMRHASGDEVTLAELTGRFERQTAALMAAAELVMTGRSNAAKGGVPFDYEVGGWDAGIERFHFTADAERGTLTNYRLKIG